MACEDPHEREEDGSGNTLNLQSLLKALSDADFLSKSRCLI